ncbi:MAG: PD40 domain-containing protein, partial [Chloroflexi bacterium]|nr:PD40 domain-containing protein [Chloroflexota bacterium]
IEEVAGSAAFSWSPDGKRVAYIASTQAQNIVRGKLNFYDVAKGTKVTADQDKISAFFWSPDSKQAVYFAIVQEPVTTPTPSKGTPAPTPEDQPAPETQLYLKMYITDVTSGRSTLLARFVPTRDFFQLIQFFDQYARSGTIWAPDGQNLVVAAQMSDSQGVFLVPSSGNTEPRFLQGGAMAFWSWK